MAFIWTEAPTTKLPLPSGNTIEVRAVDMVGLALSSDNADLPNGLLDQVSGNLSGQAPDRELVCHSGVNMPLRGEPCSQGNVRGRVVDVSGLPEAFTVRVSMISAGEFKPGELRFGGMNMATVETNREYRWRPGNGGADQARQELSAMGAFIDLVVRAASVMPRLVKEVTDPETELLISKVIPADKMVIFNWAMPREVRPAGTFPQEPAAGVAAAPDVQTISPESGDGVRADTSVGEVAVQP